MKPTVLLGVTGGIAAVKVPALIAKLQNRGLVVETILTPSAARIIDSQEIKNLTGKRPYTTLFPRSFSADTILNTRHVEHIDLADRASLYVIVPATANSIAKLAHGIADDYLTTTALAVTCPVLVCPSMNVHMWHHPTTQENVAKLRHLGYHIAGPARGMLACGYEGTGRLIDTAMLTQTIVSFSSVAKPLLGKNALVTAGGTIEPIDDVRMITNKSSGKMGVAMAHALVQAGATVILLRSRTSVSPELAMQEEEFDTAESLEKRMKKYLPTMDICIHAAAVSDFSVKNARHGKTSSDTPLSLELEPRKKILDSIKRIHPSVFLVAFKAESRLSPKKLVSLAQARLAHASADLIIANDVGRDATGFGSDMNDVYVITAAGQVTHIPLSPKSVVAQEIIKFL